MSAILKDQAIDAAFADFEPQFKRVFADQNKATDTFMESLLRDARERPRFLLYSALVECFDGRGAVYVTDAVEIARGDTDEGFDALAKALPEGREAVSVNDMTGETEIYSAFACEWQRVEALKWSEREPVESLEKLA